MINESLSQISQNLKTLSRDMDCVSNQMRKSAAELKCESKAALIHRHAIELKKASEIAFEWSCEIAG